MLCRRLCTWLVALLLPAALHAQPAATLGRPRPFNESTDKSATSQNNTATSQFAASLGRPVPMTQSDNGFAPRRATIRMSEYDADSSTVQPASSTSFQPSFTPPDYPPAPPVPPPGPPSNEDFLNGRPNAGNCTPDCPPQPPPPSFGDRIIEWLRPGSGRDCDTKRWFESDHAFDYLAEPVSSPFLFEDPRALTELKPIFMYQSIPNGALHFHGGNIEYYGLQGRVAFNDRISLVFNEFGFLTINPGSGSDQPGGTGFSELRVGPKFTFLRDTKDGMVAAAGLTFDIPTGPDKVYQNTGSLSVIPYLSFAKNFGSTRFGSFNFMDSIGFAFASDSKRSEYLYNVAHIDWDFANNHRFYPLMEVKYIQYTRSGTERSLTVEGQELANFGDGGVAGRAEVDWAFGFRYKFSEATQVGLTVEFPLGGHKDMNDFRLTIDFIWRY